MTDQSRRCISCGARLSGYVCDGCGVVIPLKAAMADMKLEGKALLENPSGKIGPISYTKLLWLLAVFPFLFVPPLIAIYLTLSNKFQTIRNKDLIILFSFLNIIFSSYYFSLDIYFKNLYNNYSYGLGIIVNQYLDKHNTVFN